MSPKSPFRRGKKFKREQEARRREVQEDRRVGRDYATQHKHRAHRIFDMLWRDGYMSRDQAYDWLKGIFPDGIEHIAEMDYNDSEKLIRAVRKKIPIPNHI